MATRRYQDSLDDNLAARLFAARALTLDLAAPLSDADAAIQPHQRAGRQFVQSVAPRVTPGFHRTSPLVLAATARASTNR